MTEPQAKGGPSLTKQTFWFASAKTIAFVLTSIVPLLLVRLLDQSELGLYKQAFLVVASAQRMLTLGFGLSAFYFFPRMRGVERPIVANVLFFNLGIGLAAWLVLTFYPPLLGRIFNSPELVPHASLIGVVILLWVFSSFLEVAPAAMQETKLSTILIVAMQVSRMAFMLVAALYSASLPALLWSAVAHGIVQSAIMLWFFHTRFPGFLTAFSRKDFAAQFSYILPLTLAYFVGVLGQDLPQYLVAAHFGPSLYAIFTTGTFQLPLINILHESVGMVLTPTVSRLHHEGKEREITQVLVAAMRKTAAIAFPVYAGLVMVSHEFIVLLYTKLYADSAPIFAVNLAMLPLTVFIYEPLIRTFEPVRRMLVWVRIVLLIVLVAAVWAGIRQNSMTSAIYAVVIVAAIERLVICGRMAKILKLGWGDWRLFQDIGKIALASALGACVVEVLRWLLSPYGPLVVLLVCGAVFCAVYVTALFLLRVPSAEERAGVVRMLRKVWPRPSTSEV